MASGGIGIVFRQFIGCLSDQIRALKASPRPLPQKSLIYVAKSYQAVEDGIHPVIKRHIRRSDVCRRGASIAPKDIPDRSPVVTAQLWIMMPAVNVLCDEIADQAADEYVRGKMLPGAHARKVDRGRQTIDEQLGEGPGVFMRNHPRDRPSGSGVFRREGCATLEKVPAAIALKRSPTSQRILQSFNNHQAVQGRFTGKKSSLAPVRVVVGVAQQPHPSRGSNERSYACV